MENDTSNDENIDAGELAGDTSNDATPAGDRPPANKGSKRTVEAPPAGKPRRRQRKSAPPAADVEQDVEQQPPAPPETKSKRTRAAGGGRRRSLKPQLVDLITAGGTALVIAGAARPSLGYDGGIILENADRLADELVKMGKRNPAVQRALESLVTTSEYGGSLLVFGAVALPIAANHGLLPREVASLVGAPVPPARPAPVDDDVEQDGRPPAS